MLNLKKIWVHRSGDYHAGLNWTEDVIPNSSQQTSFQATPLWLMKLYIIVLLIIEFLH